VAAACVVSFDEGRFRGGSTGSMSLCSSYSGDLSGALIKEEAAAAVTVAQASAEQLLRR
jgi:hypothetical protein